MANRPKTQFQFLGHHPCLDFINTEAMENGRPVDRLQRPADLVRWLLAAGLVTRQDLGRLSLSGRDGKHLLAAARQLRSELRAAAEKMVARMSVPASTVASVNRLLERDRSTLRLRAKKGGFRLEVRRQFHSAVDLLVPLAVAASDLLTQADFRLIRKCENPRCILYFYDVSKNHARRWCSMQGCGSQHKAREYYQRKRQAR